jgi:uncharacterized membrane protein
MAMTVLLVLGSWFWPRTAAAQAPTAAPTAQATTLEAVVTGILEQGSHEVDGQPQHYQLLELRITAGPRAGRTVKLRTGEDASANLPRYAVGDALLLTAEAGADGREVLYIEDRVRRAPLAGLLVLFVVVVVAVGRWRGLASLAAMGLSFAVIFLFLLPRISAGDNPIAAAILSALIIIPATYYLSHGVNRKTHAAVAGTLVALAVTGLLAVVAVDATVITGYASEEASFLQVLQPGLVNIRGLLLASIIIGLSGILDDITISQSAVVAQLRSTGPDLSLREVYRRSMDVGRDHIASLVNTLVLVYASSALPLLLLFLYSGAPWSEVVNYEIVAQEIVRTLVASIGLVLAVPLTTAIACYMLRDPLAADDVAADDGHGHAGHTH